MAESGGDPLERAIDGVKGAAIQDALRTQARSATDDEKTRVLRLAQDIQDSQSGIGWPALLIGGGLLAWLIYHLARATGTSPLTDVATGRPILMLIVIITTVVYGGMLLNASLYGKTSDDFDSRFQRGREVFLVFSGICATVVGFYFGSSTGSPLPANGVSLSTSLGAGGVISVTVAGGAPPYALTLTKDGKSLPLAGDEGDSAKFRLAVSESVCPAGGNFRVSGANGAVYPDIAVAFSAEDLRAAGVRACGTTGNPVVPTGAATTATGTAAAAPQPAATSGN